MSREVVSYDRLTFDELTLVDAWEPQPGQHVVSGSTSQVRGVILDVTYDEMGGLDSISVLWCDV